MGLCARTCSVYSPGSSQLAWREELSQAVCQKASVPGHGLKPPPVLRVARLAAVVRRRRPGRVDRQVVRDAAVEGGLQAGHGSRDGDDADVGRAVRVAPTREVDCRDHHGVGGAELQTGERVRRPGHPHRVRAVDGDVVAEDRQDRVGGRSLPADGRGAVAGVDGDGVELGDLVRRQQGGHLDRHQLSSRAVDVVGLDGEEVLAGGDVGEGDGVHAGGDVVDVV